MLSRRTISLSRRLHTLALVGFITNFVADGSYSNICTQDAVDTLNLHDTLPNPCHALMTPHLTRCQGKEETHGHPECSALSSSRKTSFKVLPLAHLVRKYIYLSGERSASLVAMWALAWRLFCCNCSLVTLASHAMHKAILRSAKTRCALGWNGSSPVDRR